MSAYFFTIDAHSDTQSNRLIAECAHRIIEEALSGFFIPTAYWAFIGERDDPSYEASKPLLWENGIETVTKNGVGTAPEGLVLGRSQSPDVRSEMFHFFDHVLAEDDLFEFSCHGLVHLHDGVSGKSWYDYEKRKGGYESIVRISFSRDSIDIPLFGGTSSIEFSSDSAVWMPLGRVYESPPPDDYRDYDAGVAIFNIIELAKHIAKAGDSYKAFADESYLSMGRWHQWGPDNLKIAGALLASFNPRLGPS